MSSTSSGCQPKRSASPWAVSTSGETTLIQVSALAESSWTTGAGEMTGVPPRARERRMRGRLGMGTQWVVLRQRHVLDCSPGACLLKLMRLRARSVTYRARQLWKVRREESPDHETLVTTHPERRTDASRALRPHHVCARAGGVRPSIGRAPSTVPG